MKPKEEGLTLRQRYEQGRQGNKAKPTPASGADVFLSPLMGQSVIVRFQGGDEITAVLSEMDRFTLKLDCGMVVFKHAIQSVRPASGSR